MPRPAARSSDPPLARYRAKRNFQATPEPPDAVAPAREKQLSFVIQKHWATRLHYDFRLELDGVLLSWAVPKGPSFDPADKRMAIHVEDHPVSYGGFEGTIPKGNYGAGTVIVWDQGTWEPAADPRQGLKDGKLVFRLHGQKLAGLWELVRIAKPGDRQEAWMLFKKRDEWARPHAEYDVVAALPDSVVARPLGQAEEREPRSAPVSASAAPATGSLAEDLSKAKKARLPASLSPQLATLASSAPEGGRWIVESKFDGYRLLARVDKARVQLFTRNGNDWTDRLQPLADELASMGLGSCWLDGEIVVLDERGVPDFNALQNAIDGHRNGDIVYFVFDLPFHDGLDLRAVPVEARRARLQSLLGEHPGERVRLSRSFDAQPAQVLQAACAMGLEGVLLKRADAPYASTRTDTWLKLKCQRRQEFVVVGYTERTGAVAEVGGLLLAYHENGRLVYAGNVGTGWNAATGRDLKRRLAAMEIESPPLDATDVKPGRWSRRSPGGEHWVRPEMVVEVSFTEWTPDGRVRHPSFKGVRSDKPAKDITREQSAGAVQAGSAATGVKVTNPDRVIDPSTGLKKIDLVRYYESVAEWILPHLKDRPVSLVRGPQGVGGELFFQKHPETRMPGLTVLDASLWPKHEPLLAVQTAEALASAAQMNVIEFHTWNSTIAHIDQPDRVIFDLDPGEGVPWKQVQEAALLVRTLLEELSLKAWLKTSGGKGLHVVVPLAPKLDYEAVKGFSQAVVVHIAQAIPQRFVAKAGGANRVQRIFIDYLRNGHSQTTAAAFSARARPGLGVSMPVAWEQLMELKSAAQWTVANAREYLSFRQADPWAGYAGSRQTLTRAMKTLGFTPSPSPRREV